MTTPASQTPQQQPIGGSPNRGVQPQSIHAEIRAQQQEQERQAKTEQIALGKIRGLLRTDDGKLLMALVIERLTREMRRLCYASEMVEIGRSQGNIEAYQWLRSLEEGE